MADNASTEVADPDDPLGDIVWNVFQLTHDVLFTPERDLCLKSCNIAPKTNCQCSQRYRIHPLTFTRNDEEVTIHFLNEYMEGVDASIIGSPEIAIGKICKLVCNILNPQFDDDSYTEEFKQGLSNYVLLRGGISDIYRYNGRTIAECLWYGPQMPYFLDWMNKKYGKGTIRKLVAAFGPQYDQTVFETVIGTPVLSLWRMYCASLREKHEGLEKEELNAEFSELWPIPTLRHGFSHDRKQEWKVISCNNLEPVDALTNAVLAIFKHLYTPKTVPLSGRLKEICLFSQSGPMEKPIEGNIGHPIASLPECDLVISWDFIKSEKPSGSMMIGLLVLCISEIYRLVDFNGVDPGLDHRWPSTTLDTLTHAITAYVLVQEGFVPARIPGARRSENTGMEAILEMDSFDAADFLCWLESRFGEGTVKRLYQRVSRERYDPTWLEDLTGMSLKELCNEYGDTFPDKKMPEMILFLSSSTVHRYTDISKLRVSCFLEE